MKNLFKTIKNTITRAVTKATDFINFIAMNVMMFKQNTKLALANNRGEGYLDTVIKLLIAIVLGALLLAGLYALFNDVVMPRLEIEVTEMFDYDGK